MKYIFLDTNILVHYKEIEQIDWLRIIGDNSCEIIVAPIVIDELEQLKIKNKASVRKVKKLLNEIEDYSNRVKNEIRTNVFVSILFEKPKQITYDNYGLNFNEQDHRLFATVLEYKDAYKERQIILISNDTGVRIRAKHYRINALKLPEENKLPEESDPDVVKIRELEIEIRKLKLKIPKPLVTFDNGKDFIQFKIFTRDINWDRFIEEKMAEIISSYPRLEKKKELYDDPNKIFLPVSSIFSDLSKEQIDDYSTSLISYFEKYKDYLNKLCLYYKRDLLSVIFSFILFNDGNTPAEVIDILFHFPDGFQLFDYDEFQDIPQKPIPPKKPKNLLEQFNSFNTSANMPYDFSNISHPPSIDLKINKPSIKKTNSYDVNYEIGYIKHFHKIELEKVVALYESFEKMKNFQINYSITAENIPEQVHGVLNVSFGFEK
jgi:rRNA-processing protein FCF1